MKSSEAMIFAVMKPLTLGAGPLDVSGFIAQWLHSFVAQLVRASHRNREVTGSNPVEVLNFSGFSTQLQKLRS